MPSVSESISLSNSAFSLSPNGKITTTIELRSLTAKKYGGMLVVTLFDPEFKKIISSNTVKGLFSSSQPFTYEVNLLPKEKKSYQLHCKFTESASGDSIIRTINTAYILTPAEKATPQINAVEIYGARPGHEFLYKVPATGRQPLTYKAKGLPTGLQVDAKTGIITGKVSTKGDYNIELTVSNSLGVVKKNLLVKIGDRIGFTPALGWNSWNAWGLSVSDEKVRISAKQMAGKLSAHGWAYINIDDGWEAPQRAANGEMVTNKKFPDMHALSSFVHGLGLKFGIYSSPGDFTCGGYLGSLDHELQDAQTYNKWGVDYLKYDWCSYSTVAGKSPSLDALKKPYFTMQGALNQVDRDIIYSLCQYGWGDVYKWGAEVGGNSWRTTGDIVDTWESMSRIGFAQAKSHPYATGSGFIDPDMLIVGKVGWGPRLHDTRLTPDEQYFHISLWALLSSPLLIGCDMGQLDEFTLSLLNNDEVIAIDQDVKAIQAKQVVATNEHQVWVKELNSGAKAAGIFNTTNDYKTITIKWSDLGVSGYKSIRDVWSQKEIGNFGADFTVKLPPHGVKLVKLH